jgi:hypothetical protein
MWIQIHNTGENTAYESQLNGHFHRNLVVGLMYILISRISFVIIESQIIP